MPFKIIAGQDVYDAQQQRKHDAMGNKRDSEWLCQWQQIEARNGIVEAEIVKSIYGYSVRHASGLQNFSLIASCRRGQLDGTLDAAIAFAKGWQSADPTRRYVTMWE